MSASDGVGGGGADRRGAPGAAGLGAAHDPVPLKAERVSPLPGRSSIYRCLVRHGLIEPAARRRKKADYKRWERSRAMELWQMDIVGGVRIVDRVKASIVSGVDDHCRFVISARVVERATTRPVCDALAWAMRTHGVPQEVLTDTGKVFTGRFGPGSGEVARQDLPGERDQTHPHRARSPTTTGKVERWHKTLRREFLNGRVFDSIADAQEQLDRWVHSYNHERRHQGIGDVVPWEWFRLANIRTGRTGRADRGSRQRLGGSAAPARSASPWCRIRSGCGSTVRPSRCPSPTGSSASTTGVCSSPPTSSGTGRPRRGLALAGNVKAKRATAVPSDRRAVRDPQGRLVRQRVCSPGRTTASGERTSAANRDLTKAYDNAITTRIGRFSMASSPSSRRRPSPRRRATPTRSPDGRSASPKKNGWPHRSDAEASANKSQLTFRSLRPHCHPPCQRQIHSLPPHRPTQTMAAPSGPSGEV